MNKALLKLKSAAVLKNPLTPIIGVGLVVGLATGLYVNKIQNKGVATAQLDEQVLGRLNELQSHIISLESAAQKPLPEIDLSALEQKLKELGREVSDIRHFNHDELNNKIENRLNQTEHRFTEQLNTLSQTVSDIKTAGQQVKYLPVESLPFSVLSIDSIQSVPVATIGYDFKTVPLEKDDLLAGWRVVFVDFRHQEIEFENKNKEHIILKQENIG